MHDDTCLETKPLMKFFKDLTEFIDVLGDKTLPSDIKAWLRNRAEANKVYSKHGNSLFSTAKAQIPPYTYMLYFACPNALNELINSK